MFERLTRLYNAKRLTKQGLKMQSKTDGSPKTNTRKSQGMSMSDIEIFASCAMQ